MVENYRLDRGAARGLGGAQGTPPVREAIKRKFLLFLLYSSKRGWGDLGRSKSFESLFLP